MCKKLTIEELKFLKNLYKVEWPKFVPTFGLLSHLIERFEKHPEWQEKVHFLTTNADSLKCGTFLMNYCNYAVMFNSLEAAPYSNLEKLLNELDFSEEKKLWTMEVHHVEVVEKIVKSKNLEKLFEDSSKCTLHVFNKDIIKLGLEMFAKPPKGFYYDSLKLSDIPRMSEISHYETPSWYYENVIKYNITTGLYTNDGKIVAWTALHDVAESGMINVDPNYRRQKLATGIVLQQAAKVFETGKVIFGHVFDRNEAAMIFFDSTGHAEIIGRHRWMDLREKKSAMRSSL